MFSMTNDDRDPTSDRTPPAPATAATKPFGKFRIPAHWKVSSDGGKVAIIGPQKPQPT